VGVEPRAERREGASGVGLTAGAFAAHAPLEGGIKPKFAFIGWKPWARRG
jgi:hypothetical protein